MRTIALGDIHGRQVWKEIAKQDFDRLIFIGDYFDAKETITGDEQLQNFLEICAYKRTTGREVIMLVGNHDFHYWPGIRNARYSGYQPRMAKSFTEALEKNREMMQMCFKDESEVLYSHAGLTKTFLGRHGIVGDAVKEINNLFSTTPNAFSFYDGDESGHGGDKNQSCIWVRPTPLTEDKAPFIQVVGHTMRPGLFIDEHSGLAFIDTLGTSGEYLQVERGSFLIRTLENETNHST